VQCFGTISAKKIKQLTWHFDLAEIQMTPTQLPKIKPSFTKQYSIKGGHQEVSKTI
jgi:hypothetical protein